MWDGDDDDSQYYWSVRSATELRGAVTAVGPQGGRHQGVSLLCIKPFSGSPWNMASSRRFLGTSNKILCTCCPSSSVSHLLYTLLLSASPASFQPHQPGPISPNLLSDALGLCWTAQVWNIFIITCNSADSADLQGKHLRWARRLQIPGGCEVVQDRLRRQQGAVAEVWTWTQETWFLVWALPLPSCVVWDQMLGLSGPQWFVKLGFTSHLDDCCFFPTSLVY